MNSTNRELAVIAVIVVAVVLAVLLAGCGIGDPYRTTPATTPTATATGPRVVDNEVRGAQATPIGGPRDAAALSPQSAVERFAALYINWTYNTLASHRRQLARMAVGEVAAAERRAAVETSRDYELREGQVANHGQIAAIAQARGHADQWVVVSREITTGRGTYEGLPAGYHVTLATVVRVASGWAVSRWQPQS